MGSELGSATVNGTRMTMRQNLMKLVLVLAVSVMAEGAASAQVAADVADRPTLKAFVLRAAALVEARVSTAEASYDFMDTAFRDFGEWRSESIYIFAGTTEGVTWFHAAYPDREGRQRYDVRDKNGVHLIRELIAAAEAGGGFVEYYAENPAADGEGSPKVSYAVLLDLPGEPSLYFGSGYYPATATPAVPAVGLVVLAVLLVGAARSRRWA